jgi:orotidine-5'-phosphate decarboxylase
MSEQTPKSPDIKLSPQSEFTLKLEQRWQQGHFVCVGLDSDVRNIPAVIRGRSQFIEEQLVAFNAAIVDATHDLVCAFKPNAAFYEMHGEQGHRALKKTIQYIHEQYPSIPVILDAKRADIGSTNAGYVAAVFDEFGADAVTVNPYFGKEALKPFLDRQDKGIIVLVRTSNLGAGELQDLPVGTAQEPLYQVLARNIATSWNDKGNVAVVVGATFPQELTAVRSIIGDMPILIPGIGAQGGEVEATVTAGRDSRGMGMIINSSRGIIFASKGGDFAQVARVATETLGTQINTHRTSQHTQRRLE